ncbi:hypothetical protein EDB85DRAFT_2024298, partial [Lactarius pseudohatsudake]
PGMARPRVPPSRAYEAVRSRKGRGRGAVCGAPLFQCGRVGGWRALAYRVGEGEGPMATGRGGGVPLVRTSSAQMGKGPGVAYPRVHPSCAYGAACPRTPPSARMGKGAGGGVPSRKGRRSRGKGRGRGQRGEGWRALVCPFRGQGGKGGTGGNGERGRRHPFRANGEGRRRRVLARMGRDGPGRGREGGGGRPHAHPFCANGRRGQGEREGRRRGTADPRAPPFRANGAAACPCAALPREWDGGTWGDGRGPEGGTACPRAPHFYANGVARTGGRVGGGIPSCALSSCAHFLRSNGAAVNAGEGEEGGRLTLVHPCLRTNGAARGVRDVEGRRPVLLRPLST